jgi:hypothetical protein
MQLPQDSSDIKRKRSDALQKTIKYISFVQRNRLFKTYKVYL